jgi:CBS domain-containing protein
MSVNNVMTKEVISLRSTSTVKDAWLTMMEADISGAPVVDDTGSIMGVVSLTDIFREVVERVQKARSLRETTMQIEDAAALEKEEIREMSIAIRAVTELKVADILPKEQKLLTLSPDDSLDRAIHLIAEHGINRLPVVRGTQVVGIITRQDIIWSIAGKGGKSNE